MNRSFRPLFLTAFSILSVAAIAAGLVFTEAEAKVKPKTSSKQSISSPSTVLLTENFDYAASSFLTANGWTAHSGSGTNPIAVASSGLSYPGYAGSGVGNAASMVANGEDVNRAFAAPATSGSLYAAFLVNVSSSTATGDYFFHYHVNSSTFWGRVWAKKDAVTNSFSFGLSRSSTPSGGEPVFTPATYQPNTTYLVVVKYTFVDGANNDSISLFVNPTPGGSEPIPNLTAGDLLLADPANLAGVGLRQGGTSTGSTQQVDGIRVATTWAEAVASGAPAAEPKGVVDLNGDGKTDFTIVREVGAVPFAGLAGGAKQRRVSGRERIRAKAMGSPDRFQLGGSQMQWWTQLNNMPSFGAISTVDWGNTGTDEPLAADFDGDGSDDVTVWRTGSFFGDQAYYYSINSADFTARTVAFGTQNDNPMIVGDYDGDGIDDPAVYRCPSVGSGQCYFYYLGSLNNPEEIISYVPFGTGSLDTYLPVRGDYNGDGKFDFVLQGADPGDPESGVFYIYISGTNEFTGVQWGRLSDRLIPGDFDGDGKADIAVTRVIDDALYWFVLESDGGVQGFQWGGPLDFEVAGDYDGDGKDDFAVYRWNDTDATFFIQPSGGTAYSVNWGGPFDYPVAFFLAQ